jgi:hypothetical protein
MVRRGVAVLGLLGQLVVLLEVGSPAADGSALARPPAARVPAALLAARGRRRAEHLAAHLRGGGGGFDATPPLLATPGFDARCDEEETEEFVVGSPGAQVLPPAGPGEPRSGAQPPRAPRAGEHAPMGAARRHAPGMRALGVPGSGALHPALPRGHLATTRPGTPGPARSSAGQGAEQQQPQSCGAPLSLDERVQQVETTLSDRTSDWAKRVRAFKELQAIIKSLAPAEPPDASASDPRVGVLLRMLPGICTQLQDKRSSLVKEVCNTIIEMARLLGDAFEPAAVKIVPTLLSLTFVTIRVISAAAWYSTCILSP